ncbi:HTH-type transcriptional regulator GltC [Microbacterium hydrocarbonoxydans]|uniref:HTH-type transcriptional regulator GltC n=1 Tax=Microbacterium hydrocarbonoxydans TaxID=273678 RepID=A0A0M2HSD4_9MICO|nr:LysR family transcriptional regulator [Microbacterium hydrocarbonoxydans]KJL47383.1 HTH-type transcriptional regulator GltC [Microbacterium hydrocarbonoxydans]
MNLEQLRSFVEVARLGHFTRASESLHLAQPSLSRQISTLERELGAELFQRARGNISLTAAGETLLPRAQRMLAEAESIREEMGELAGLRRGRVRLGAPPTLCISLVAEALSAFRARHPGVDLHLTESGSRLLVEQLAVGAVDIALITESDAQPVSGVSLTRTPLLAEELVVVSSASAPALTRDEVISLDLLATLPLIAFDHSYSLRATTDAAFRAAGLTPTMVLEGAEMDAVLRFVERGVGVAVVPAMVLLDRPELRSARLAHPSMTRTISLAHRSDVTPALAVAEMRRAIVSTAAEVARRDPAITSLQ